MYENNHDRNHAIIAYLVNNLHKEYPGKPVGKTIIQKMFYFLTREKVTNFDFSMHYYGPYTSEVSHKLNLALNNGLISMDWNSDYGYSIETKKEGKDLISSLSYEDTKKIDEIIGKYGKFNSVEISFIATALYIRDEFNTQDEELVDVVHSLKKNYGIEKIESVLKQAGIL